MSANMSAKGSSNLSRGSGTPTALESRRRKAITPPAALRTATGGSYSASLSSGNHEAPVDMMKEFRTCMSELLDERLANLVTQVADLTTEVTALKARLGDLEREKTDLAATVRILTDDASNTAVQGGPVGAPLTSDAANAGPVVQLEPYNLSDIIAEEVERSNRTTSVLVRGLPASWNENLSLHCSTLFKCSTSDLLEVEHLRPRGAEHATPAPGPAPVRVRFGNKHLKAMAYKDRLSLKVDGRDVYVNNDMTRQQQTKQKAVLPKYKQHRAKKVKCSLPYDAILDDKGTPLSLSDEAIQDLLSTQ
eukprot:scpid42946/ scgid14958/ 